MLKETFSLDGVEAASVGIFLQKQIEISGLVPIVDTVHVPGRNGDLTFPTGAYKNRTGKIECYVSSPGNIGKAHAAAAAFLLNGFGYRKLVCSEDPDHYWMARVTNAAEIDYRLRHLAPITVKLDVMPQRWVKQGEPIVIDGQMSDTEFISAHTGVSLPKIKVVSKFPGSPHRYMLRTIDIENQYFTYITSEETDKDLIIDSETENAYNEDGSMNNMITVQGGRFPKIFKGTTKFITTGASLIIEPRWWDL